MYNKVMHQQKKSKLLFTAAWSFASVCLNTSLPGLRCQASNKQEHCVTRKPANKKRNSFLKKVCLQENELVVSEDMENWNFL